jgi:hypothetical protein
MAFVSCGLSWKHRSIPASHPTFPPYGFRSLFRHAFVFIYPFDDFIEEIKLFLLYSASRDLIVFHYYYVRMKKKKETGI